MILLVGHRSDVVNQSLDVGRSKTSDGVPSSSSIVTKETAKFLSTTIVTRSDIVEGSTVGVSIDLIKKRIDESKRRFILVETNVVKESHDTSPDWGGTTGAIHNGPVEIGNDKIAVSKTSNVRDTSVVLVV